MRDKRRVQKPIVAIEKSENESDALNKALSLLPLNEIFRPGDVVVITPNLVKNEPPQTGTIVGPETLRDLIQKIKLFKPKRIIVACGSGGDPTPVVATVNGIMNVISEEKVEFVDLNYGPYTTLKLNHDKPCETKINTLIDNMDVLVSFTQLKQHQEATVSLSLKNIALSWPPAEIHGFPKMNLGIHENLHGFIAAMCEKIPIDLAIISTDNAMVGTGPSGGKPVKGDIVIAGTDPVATDTIGAEFLGFLPQAVGYLYALGNKMVGATNKDYIDLKGIPLKQAIDMFSKAAYGFGIKI